jgi:cardiolipin synthase (CMP-forming)
LRAFGKLDIYQQSTRHQLSTISRAPQSWRPTSICSDASSGKCGSIETPPRLFWASNPHLSQSALRPSQHHRPISTFTSLLPLHRQHSNSIRYASTAPPDPKKPSTIFNRLTPTAIPHENIYTIPNILTFTRLLSAPAIGYLLLTSQPLAALCLFAYAGLTDLVDGYLARRLNAQTVVGTVIDPMADKTLMTITVACLGLTGQFPWWLVVIILGRDVCLAISAIYFRWISLPPPKTFGRYWDFSLPSAEVRPTEISKINTLLQLLLVGNAMVLPVLPTSLVEMGNLGGVLEGWEYLVAATTVWSGLSYVGNKDAVKILSREEREERMEEMGVKIKDGEGKGNEKRVGDGEH